MMKYSIAKEGVLPGGILFVLGIVFLYAGWSIAGVTAAAVGLFVLYFFRYPDRESVFSEGAVYAPADGRVICLKEELEADFFGAVVNKVSIFMNIFNVHITYAPSDGNVAYLKYNPGKFLKADTMCDDTREVNENNLIGINNGIGKVAIRQVAGLIARRIVCDIKPGDKLTAGKRIGLIRFGSRIDVYLPKEYSIRVKNGERMQAGRSVLARYGKDDNR